MGFWTKLNKFTDKIDPAARWTENKVFGKNDPTFGDHKAPYQAPPYVYNGPALPQSINPMSGIPSQYTSQHGGMQMGGLQPMQMYQNRGNYQPQAQTDASMAPMQMYNTYQQTGQAPGAGGSAPSVGGK